MVVSNARTGSNISRGSLESATVIVHFQLNPIYLESMKRLALFSLVEVSPFSHRLT
jgi:hypothetical protein